MAINGIEPEMLRAWLAGRSIARGLPPPVAEHGGFRVDTASETETSRWVFPRAMRSIASLARSISTPGRPIKACCDFAALAVLMPSGWIVEATGWFMIGSSLPDRLPLPDGFMGTLRQKGEALEMTVVAPGEALAARGYAGETRGGFAYDRIATEPDYRRRGLGRAIMAGLASAKRDPGVPDLLVATDMGRALYETIGWRALSAYSTATHAGGAS